MKLIGKSLSFCIRDIALGYVSEGDVICIKTSTNAPDLETVLAIYADTYWRTFREEALDIARRFNAEGKIEQPKLHGGEGHNIADGHWVISSFD